MTATMEAPAVNGNGGGQQLVRRGPAYQPLAPIGSPGALKSLLESQKGSLAEMLPRHITPERLFKTMLVAANRTPDLLQCTQASLLETINRAAELGLDLSGTLGEAYPVPFNNKVNGQWMKQCQLIIGYRGYAKLARQSGEVAKIEADVVHVNDEFKMTKGSDGRCSFAPLLIGDRGEIAGAFAYVRFKDGSEQYDFMTFDQIEAVRLRSKSGSAQKDTDYARKGDAIGAWKSDWPEMAKKTVFRRVAKWLPLSTEKFVAAMEYDGEDHNIGGVLEASTAVGEKAGLRGKLTARPVSENQTFEPDAEAEDRVAAQESGQGEIIDASTGEVQEPGTPTNEPQDAAPAPADVSTAAAFEASCKQAGRGKYTDTQFGKRTAAWMKLNGAITWAQAIDKTTPAQRQALLAWVSEGRLGPDGTEEPPQG